MSSSLLPSTWQIPEKIRIRLGKRVGRQRPIFEEGHLLLVLHAPPKPDDPARTGKYFWRNLDGQWASNGFGSGIQALGTHIDEYEDAVAQLDRLEEQATTADQFFHILENLAPVYRAARNMHQVLQDARKLCPDDPHILNMRDRAYAVERNAELLFEGAKNALDFAVAKRAEDQALSSRNMALAAHRLNILAAFFFPIATLTTIFGVNLKHGYEEQFAPFLFVGTISVGLLLGLILTVFVTKRQPPIN